MAFLVSLFRRFLIVFGPNLGPTCPQLGPLNRPEINPKGVQQVILFLITFESLYDRCSSQLWAKMGAVIMKNRFGDVLKFLYFFDTVLRATWSRFGNWIRLKIDAKIDPEPKWPLWNVFGRSKAPGCHFDWLWTDLGMVLDKNQHNFEWKRRVRARRWWGYPRLRRIEPTP